MQSIDKTFTTGYCSYEDLYTHDGVLYDSFKGACIAHGLLEHDGEWIACLHEAAQMNSGGQLRNLFVVILTMSHPSNPRDLWTRFRANICDDLDVALQRKGVQNRTEERIFDYGLYLLEKILKSQNTTLRIWDMPSVRTNWLHEFGIANDLISEQRDWDQDALRQSAAVMEVALNAGQRAAYQIIMTALATGRHQSFFLHGPGGTGKTYLYRLLCNYMRAEGKIVLCVASSGIAALLLPGGRTSHSRFRIPLDIAPGSVCGIKKNSPEADLIRETSLIIWDEVGTQDKECHIAVERTLRDICGDVLFGRITVLFGGDFMQILPIIIRGSRPDIVGATIQRAIWWPHLEILHLTENMRVGNHPDEQAFARWQLEVGEGKHTDRESNIIIPPAFHCPENTVESLISTVYPNIFELHPTHKDNDKYFADRTILSARNKDVDELNLRMLMDFPGAVKEFNSADTVVDKLNGDVTMYPAEYLNSITASGLPLAKLQLKVGVPVIVMRNLAAAEGVCNGTRGVVIQMTNRVVEIRLITGDCAGSTFFVPRVKMETSQGDIPFTMSRLQFPLRLAFSMSINKSQGQSVQNVGLDLRSPVFGHGQFYVAISRVTSVHRLKIIWDPKSEQAKTKNVVYPEVLLHPPPQVDL